MSPNYLFQIIILFYILFKRSIQLNPDNPLEINEIKTNNIDINNQDQTDLIDKSNENLEIIIKFTKNKKMVINHFNILKENLESQYKNIIVKDEDYHLVGIRKKISFTIIALELILSGIITCSDSVKYMTQGYIPASFFDWTYKNKIIKVVFVFLIGNFINGMINNIRPFEIYCNEKLIWSGLEHKGKLINSRDLIKLIIKFGGKIE